MLSTIIFDLCIPRVCIMPVQPDFVGQGTHIKHMTTDTVNVKVNGKCRRAHGAKCHVYVVSGKKADIIIHHNKHDTRGYDVLMYSPSSVSV